MAAQNGKRPRAMRKFQFVELTLAAGFIGFHNAALCFRSDGKVIPAAAGSGLVFAGFLQCNPKTRVDATAADQTVTVDLIDEKTGEWLANATLTDAVAAGDVGKICYFLDDQTVTITASGRSPAGRVWGVDSSKGVLIERLDFTAQAQATPALPAHVANDVAPTAASLVHDAVYNLAATAAATTVTLPTAAPDGTRVTFLADGTANAHTVQYRDANGTVNLTTALVASKRHLVVCAKANGRWAANAYVAP